MKKHNIIGYLSMLLLQGNNVPNILLTDLSVNILSPIMAIIGLLGYLYYSLIQKDKLYIISNSIGILLSAIIIYKVLS